MDEIPVSSSRQAAKETGWVRLDLLKKEMLYLVNGLGQVKDLSPKSQIKIRDIKL